MQGLIVSSRKNSLQHFKKPWAHEQEPINSLLEAIKVFNMFVYGLQIYIFMAYLCAYDSFQLDAVVA